MESAAVRGGPQPPRKEWRAVSEHSFQPGAAEEAEQGKLCQSDERTIYEEGSRPLEVDFCSITIDPGGGMIHIPLQQRIQDVSRQRESLQRMEIELRAQAIARSEILDIQSGFESQIKGHSDLSAKLKDQLQERELRIAELELKLEGKERDLCSVKMDNEAAWAKEEATFRRERDNSETERTQHLQQILDLQEHFREKESQFLNLEQQHRAAQETILFKDEQLREAQTWIVRAQEMDTLQSTTNQSLQAELRERIEQFNQYYIGFQRQFVDIEQHHMQAIQQLQLELTDLRERHEVCKEGSQGSSSSSSSLGNKGSLINSKDNGPSNGNSDFITNGNLDVAPPFVPSSNPSGKVEHGPSLPVIQPPIFGMNNGYISFGQVPSLPSYVLHPQPVSSTNSLPLPSQVGHLQSMSAIPAHQHWQNQQVKSEVPVIPIDIQSHLFQPNQNFLRPDSPFTYDIAAERQIFHPEHPSANIDQHQRSVFVMNGANEMVQQHHDPNDEEFRVPQENQEILTSSQFQETSGSVAQIQKGEPKVHDDVRVSAINKDQSLSLGQQLSVSISSAQSYSSTCNSMEEGNRNASKSSEVSASSFHVANLLAPVKTVEPALLDEKSLLACIVRAIPAGSGSSIRISTTLPNRLAKMLAPYHWHDYKKRHGKLDYFVAQHPELFVIEGDSIHLREGAQEIISATTAVAKVAAAAASSVQYSSFLPSIAVTPVAQGNRHRKATSHDQRDGDLVSYTAGLAVMVAEDDISRHPPISKMQNQQSNDTNHKILQGPDIKILSKSKDPLELNSFSTDTRPNSSLLETVGNRAKLDRIGLSSEKITSGRRGFGGRRPTGSRSLPQR